MEKNRCNSKAQNVENQKLTKMLSSCNEDLKSNKGEIFQIDNVDFSLCDFPPAGS